ncbi:MAG: class I SAM-dependent rRNA methyltransferase [Bacilli bacterium]|nr:class I SAM-dependent rRNA methyltransferase [Bacilli bacterium]
MAECRIYLDKDEELRILRGHKWIYNNEIKRIEGKILSGDIVKVYTYDGQFVGQGFLNTASKIMVRMLSRQELPIDESFFQRKILSAFEARIASGFTDSFRAFFGEADGIPGLIIDKYGDYLSVQFLTLGVDQRKKMFVDLMVEIFKPKGIYERSDVTVREKEGLSEIKGLLYGEVPDSVVITEGNARFNVNIKEGQKTGTFLDQSQNHQAIARYATGKAVLDCFAHNGNFAIQSLLAGAKQAKAVDISATAVEAIVANAKLNAVEVEAIQADVFDYLHQESDRKSQYDMIILDPPAFTKTQAKLENALKGYQDINYHAIKLLTEGGILVSASCSHYVGLELFLEMLTEASAKAGKSVQLLELRMQSGDHPSLLGSTETLYLKFVICRVNTA